MNAKHTLWVEKYRPDTLEGYLGNEAFINSLKEWIGKNDFPNLLLYGPPGTGKTTAAKLVVKNINCDFIYLNCSDENGIDTIRDKVKLFASGATFKPLKVVILDEADFLTLNAQAALRNVIESFSLTTRFIFTCNFVERIIDPLQSRLTSFHLTIVDIKIVAKHLFNILDIENIDYDKHDVVNIIKKTYPDIRRALNVLQSSVNNGKLIPKNITNNNYNELIIAELKTGKKQAFNNIRQIIADNNVAFFDQSYKQIYDSFDSPEITIIVADHLQKQSFVGDKEICFMSCVSQILSVKS